MTTIETILTIGMSLVSVIATASIPWAILLERRLAHIEASLTESIKGKFIAVEEDFSEVRSTIRRHSDVIRKHDRRLMKLEQKCDIQVEPNGDR